MPPALVNLSQETLDQTTLRYLETKKETTRIAYEKCLKRFSKFYGHPFKHFLEHIEAETKANLERPIHENIRPGEDIIRGFISWHKEVGYSNYSTLQSIGAVQNILKYYGVAVSFAFIETPTPRPQKKNEKHAWTLSQIRQFVEVAEYLRDKVYILFAFQSGLSIGDILALNYEDIRKEYESGTIPLAIEGYREKTNVPLRTFIGYDTVHYLRLYLQSRPDIKNSDPLFTLLGSSDRTTSASIQKKLRDYASKLEFLYEEDLKNGYNPARPHSLRSAFRSRLTGKMDGDLIEFFMAHQLGQAKSTYMNQPLNELREIYENYEHLLSIYKTSRQSREEESAKTRIPQDAINRISGLESLVSNLIEEVETIKQDQAQLTQGLVKDLKRLTKER